MGVSAIILAAGRSTRMRSNKPKPLHEVCGKPMLGYILDACFEAGCDQAMVVVGHGKDEVISAFGHDQRIRWVEQTEQLGTGHAARMCEPLLRENRDGDAFILAGDTPLIRGEILSKLLAEHRQAGAAGSMATALLDDPTGYGRIIRDESGAFLEIVEQLDCSDAQRAIREVFPSYYCLKVSELLYALGKLTNDNKKGEYYLTDIFAILRQAGRRIAAIQAVSPDDVIAPNSRDQLALADRVMQRRIQHAIVQAGVTIVDGAQTYIESGVSVGMDTTIYPFTFIGRDSQIGGNCLIGPHAIVPRGSAIADGTMQGKALSAPDAIHPSSRRIHV